jgi:cytochrome c oxidase cbb3-type subunit 1
MVPGRRAAENAPRKPVVGPAIQGHSMSASTSTGQPVYNYDVIRQFTIMTVVWGIVGMLVGVVIAAQLAFPQLNVSIGDLHLHFGRLRPLHTNAVIFAFGGCALFASSLYVVQRTCQARLLSDSLASFVFWGWQLVILLAAVSLPMGYPSGKEYAELEWPIDILIAVVWVAYAVLFFGTIMKRHTSHIYVANWFFGAFIITVAVLHIVNSLAVPVSLTKSYSIYNWVLSSTATPVPGSSPAPARSSLLLSSLGATITAPPRTIQSPAS